MSGIPTIKIWVATIIALHTLMQESRVLSPRFLTYDLRDYYLQYYITMGTQ